MSAFAYAVVSCCTVTRLTFINFVMGIFLYRLALTTGVYIDSAAKQRKTKSTPLWNVEHLFTKVKDSLRHIT